MRWISIVTYNLILLTQATIVQGQILAQNSTSSVETWEEISLKGIELKKAGYLVSVHKIIKTFEKKLQLMLEMVQLMERGISNENKELIKFMKALQTNELYRHYAEFQDTVKKVRAQGLDN